MLTVLKILTLFLTMLTLAPGLAHLFELPNKIGLPRDAYFIVQGIYAGWAWFGVVILAAIVANLILAFRLRRHNRTCRVVRRLLGGPIAVSLAVFFNWTFPANQATLNWTTIPDGWERLRADVGILPCRQRADQYGGIPGDRRCRHQAAPVNDVTAKPRTLSTMIATAIQPPTRSDAGMVCSPMTSGFDAISIITAITGTATTPLMTALQYSAWIGSMPLKLTPTPISVARETVP